MGSRLGRRKIRPGKLEFVAFFDTQEDAEAAAADAGIGCQVCWLTYKDGLSFRPGKDSEDVQP